MHFNVGPHPIQALALPLHIQQAGALKLFYSQDKLHQLVHLITSTLRGKANLDEKL